MSFDRPLSAIGPSFADRRLLFLVLAVHAIAAWWLFGGDPIGPSWRECDTQSMARNLAFEDFDLLRPRVDWRGDTTGEVECEFPLYQGLVAVVLRFVGDVEWPGRLVSLLAASWLAWCWFGVLARCSGRRGAWFGLAALLGSAQTAYLATRVLPDATSLAFGAAGTLAFVRFLDRGCGRQLLLACALTALGALGKPTSLQFLALQAVLAWSLQRQRLREPRVWLVFAAVVAAVAAWLLHARALGLATGLTFGVTFGDVKSPAADHLLRPGLWISLAKSTATYGLGLVGALAAAALLATRRFARLDLAVGAVVALGLVGSFRYSHDAAMGPHYHAFAMLYGAWLVARCAGGVAASRAWLAALGAVIAGTAAFAVRAELAQRPGRSPTAHDATAAMVRAHVPAGDLVVFRGPKPAWDPFWRRRNNCEEPVLPYLCRRKGWVLPSDGVDGAVLADCARRGAKWYVAPAAAPEPVAAWLAAHARVVARAGDGMLFALERP